MENRTELTPQPIGGLPCDHQAELAELRAEVHALRADLNYHLAAGELRGAQAPRLVGGARPAAISRPALRVIDGGAR